MHGHTIQKFVDAKQAKDTHLYKNSKEKLYKTTAAMWYNKVCTDKQLTPNYNRKSKREKMLLMMGRKTVRNM
jgi:hypothetical protein